MKPTQILMLLFFRKLFPNQFVSFLYLSSIVLSDSHSSPSSAAALPLVSHHRLERRGDNKWARKIAGFINATCREPEDLPIAWKKEEYPNSAVDVTKCGRGCEASRICDPNGIISKKSAESLEIFIQHLQQMTNKSCSLSTSCAKRAPNLYIRLAFMHEISKEGWRNYAVDLLRNIKEFSNYLLHEWLEAYSCPSDIIIVLSEKDQILYTTTSSYVKCRLTDKCIQKIYAMSRPTLAQMNYEKALKDMLHSYRLVIENKFKCSREFVPSTWKQMLKITSIIFGVLIGSALFTVFLCICTQYFIDVSNTTAAGNSTDRIEISDELDNESLVTDERQLDSTYI